MNFGLLDENGELLANPLHYRDSQSAGMVDSANNIFGAQALFERTSVQDMWFNTTYQLMGMAKRRATALQGARQLLMLPDLLGYMLTSDRSCEHTSAATT